MPDKQLSMLAPEAIRMMCFCPLLLAASVMDLRTRMIPDSISLALAIVSLIPPEPVRMAGVLAAFPLLLAGLTVGGIGGGDIKITGACGMVLGLERAATGLLLGLLLLILFHVIRKVVSGDTGSNTDKKYHISKRDSKNEESSGDKEACGNEENSEDKGNSGNKESRKNQAYPLVPFLTAGMFFML